MSAQQLPPGRPWFRLASVARTEAGASSVASNNPPPPLPRIPVPRLQQQAPPATLLAGPVQPQPLIQPPPSPESPKVISPSYSTPPPSVGLKLKPEPEQPQSNTVQEQDKIPNGKESKEINPKTKEEEDRSLITLAGKNIGAKMEFGFGSKPEERNNREEKTEDLAVKQAKPKRLLVNSNVQIINNSIVLNATYNQHSPGVHVNFARARQLKVSQATE